MKKTPHLQLSTLKKGLSIVLAMTMLIGSQSPALAQTISGLVAAPQLTVTLIDDGSATAGPLQPPSVQDTLLEVCKAHGYGENCAKILLGMSWKESRHVATAVGDSGRAHGWFQIHYRMHKISLGCAEDLECSAHWTVNYLESNGYPKYVHYAVQCHNSCGFKNGYAESVFWNGKRLWNTDISHVAIEQIALAAR